MQEGSVVCKTTCACLHVTATRARPLRLIATASRKEREWQDRCVNYHSDGGNDAVPAPSVFCSFPERRGGTEVEPQRQGQAGGGRREQGTFLSYWVAADWSLPLSPSGGACGIRVPSDPTVCPILSGDELWLIPIWVSPAALIEPPQHARLTQGLSCSDG